VQDGGGRPKKFVVTLESDNACFCEDDGDDGDDA
jgi:hypothetical protein